MLSLEKSSEIFPRHNGVATISESFALNLVISVTNKVGCKQSFTSFSKKKNA